MVKYINSGNIFTLEGITSYAHGCNCAGAMGKGIALQFKKSYPKMYTEYKKLCKQGEFNLGDVYEYWHGEGYVFNLGTQKSWKTKAELYAIDKAIQKMLTIAVKNNIQRIAMPRVGAGLGGLKWEDVKNIINNNARNLTEVELIIVENYSE